MSRIRTIYQTDALYAGPSPSFTGHFISVSGIINNTVSNLAGNNLNLLKPIQRIQSINYEIIRENTDILEIGKKSIKHRLPHNPPTVNLNFDFLEFGVTNLLRLGFYANYSQNYSPFSGDSYFPNNFVQSLIYGFVTRDLGKANNDIQWPLNMRDRRNIFIAVSKEGTDLNKQTGAYQEIDQLSTGFAVYAFGNCYLTSYKSDASVANFPKAAVSFVCENLVYYTSGSGCAIPALEPQSGIQSTNQFAIPTSYLGTGALSALRPGDITLNITSLPQFTGDIAVYRFGTGISSSAYDGVYNLGVDVTDYKIQGYSLDLALNREPLNSLGYRLPIDRKVKFPVFSNLSISTIVGEGQTGSFINNLNKNDDYNITIKLKNPARQGIPTGAIALQFDFLRTKLSNVSFQSTIGPSKITNLNFTTELDTDDLTKGLYISGLLNIDSSSVIPYYLLKEDGSYLLKEDGGRIVINSQYLFY